MRRSRPNDRTPQAEGPSQRAVPVVGIGASAGGLGALEKMLPELPGDLSRALNDYVALLRSMIRGSFDWAYATARHSVAERAVAA